MWLTSANHRKRLRWGQRILSQIQYQPLSVSLVLLQRMRWALIYILWESGHWIPYTKGKESVRACTWLILWRNFWLLPRKYLSYLFIYLYNTEYAFCITSTLFNLILIQYDCKVFTLLINHMSLICNFKVIIIRDFL